MRRTVGVCSTSKKLSIWCLEGLPEDILIEPGRLRLVINLEVNVGRAAGEACSATWILGTNQQELGLLIS
jgi:hypothetical protein